MKTREESARFVEELMNHATDNPKKFAWHFGRIEVRELFDFIYDGEPQSEKEKLFIDPKNAMR